jgi:hypothetical protein
MRLTAGILACTLLVAADDHAKDKKGENAIMGSWVAQSVLRGGKPEKEMAQGTFVFEGGGKLRHRA